MTLLSHLECGACGVRHEADRLQNLCVKCAKPLLARYDIEAAKERVDRARWSRGRDDLWRFADMLPCREFTSLGEGMTPLLEWGHFLVKDESRNPTGSFKARGMAVAVNAAKERGATRLAVPSAGNAGAALAAYAAAVGLPAEIYLPEDTPRGIWRQIEARGARAHPVKGLITDAAREVQARKDVFDVSTLREPYRAEGKKTMGYELAAQLGWTLPDVIIYPTGGGTGIVGMWKAFEEMEALGLIGSERPRMVSVQSEGCAPLVTAFRAGAQHAEPWPDAATAAWGLRVPRAIADFLILRALRESRGTALAVSEKAIADAQHAMTKQRGIDAGPEGGAAWAGARQLLADGWLRADEKTVVFNTGAAWPYW